MPTGDTVSVTISWPADADALNYFTTLRATTIGEADSRTIDQGTYSYDIDLISGDKIHQETYAVYADQTKKLLKSYDFIVDQPTPAPTDLVIHKSGEGGPPYGPTVVIATQVEDPPAVGFDWFFDGFDCLLTFYYGTDPANFPQCTVPAGTDIVVLTSGADFDSMYQMAGFNGIVDCLITKLDGTFVSFTQSGVTTSD